MASSMSLIKDVAPNNLYIDHIGLGVNDTEAGIRLIAELTGVQPKLVDPRPDQHYWSGGLHLGKGCMLEIIGPNPKHKGFHPFKEVLKSCDEPRLLFWYLGTDKFDETRKTIETSEASGGKFKMWSIIHDRHEIPIVEEEESRNNGGTNVVEFTTGMIGPGFRSEIPNLIQWHKRPEKMKNIEKKCTVTSFQITSPQSERIGGLFASLGMSPSFKLVYGPEPNLKMTLDSPKGKVTLEGGGLKIPPFPGMLGMMTKMYFKYLFGDNSKNSLKSPKIEITDKESSPVEDEIST